jgi:hypothetical protein
MENSIEIPQKKKNRATILSINPLLGICPKEMKSVCQRTSMYIAALFTITKEWKQPKCPPTDQEMKNVCYLHTTEHLAIGENETLSLTAT